MGGGVVLVLGVRLVAAVAVAGSMKSRGRRCRLVGSIVRVGEVR